MKKIKQQLGLTLIELTLAMAITGLIATPLAATFSAQILIPKKITTEVAASKQIQKSILVLVRDAQAAQSFTPGAPNSQEYGTFAWNELAGADPIPVTAKYVFREGRVLRELARSDQGGLPIIVLDGIVVYDQVKFRVLDPVWDYDSENNTWKYTEGKLIVTIFEFQDQISAVLGKQTIVQTLVAAFRTKIERPVSKPIFGAAEGTDGF